MLTTSASITNLIFSFLEQGEYENETCALRPREISLINQVRRLLDGIATCKAEKYEQRTTTPTQMRFDSQWTRATTRAKIGYWVIIVLIIGFTKKNEGLGFKKKQVLLVKKSKKINLK